jgi:hypothetical protein
MARHLTPTLAGLLLVAGLLASSATSAHAQEEDMTMASPSQSSGIGVGVESMLSGPSGPTVVYQTPSFHVEGILGVFDRANTTFLLAGRFYYQVHSGELSDFSLGGGLGLVNTDAPGDNETDIHLEAGAKIRVFLAPNVSLSSSLGMAVVADDANDTAIIAGRLQGTMGITYFFY